MSQIKTIAGVEHMTGKVSKRSNTVTRQKIYRHPLDRNRIIRKGPNECYLQEPRDYNRHPMTARESLQREKWKMSCQEAKTILTDPTHPRHEELYQRYLYQLDNAEKPICHFGNFIRSVLASE